MTDDSSTRRDALVAALVELEHHVAAAGWDQPPRLFALVDTDVLIDAEPGLAEHLALRGSADTGVEGALTSIEQDHFEAGDDLEATLSRLMWPPSVTGCAVSLERTFLPAALEDEIPDDPATAAEFVAAHPSRQDVRVVVGAVRPLRSDPLPAGEPPVLSHGVARLVQSPDDLLGGPDLVPGLTEVLEQTLA